LSAKKRTTTKNPHYHYILFEKDALCLKHIQRAYNVTGHCELIFTENLGDPLVDFPRDPRGSPGFTRILWDPLVNLII
jgi:hypothetical protein